MKCILLIIIPAIISTYSYSQQLYFNIGGGMINYGGDLQDQLVTFNQANSAFMGGITYKLNDYFSLSAAYTHGKIAASDAKNHTETYRRNLSFYTNIDEGSLVLDVSLKSVPGTARFSPYAFAGIAVYHYNPYTYDQNLIKVYLQPLSTEGQGLPEYPNRKVYNLTQLAIPFGFGIKYAITNSIIISGEANFRNLFTDYLDDVSADSYADTAILRMKKGPVAAKLSYRSDESSNPYEFNTKLRRGNPTRKDTYYTALIKLSFSLSNINFSGNSYGRKIRKQTICPKKVF